MATQVTSIIFKITNAGKKAALQAGGEIPKVKIELSQLAVGSGRYTPNGQELALKGEIQRSPIVSGDIEIASNTLRFSSSMVADTVIPVYELGLFTTEGVLFAVAASSSTPLFTIYPNITFVGAFGLSLNEAAANSITVVTDPNGALAITLMQQHLAAPDPHPQYLNKNRFQLAMRALYPMGYQHHSHEPVNPKPIFDDILGLDTAWRRVTGKIFVSSDPSDPFINTYGLVLGQKGMTDVLASGARPHVYPLQTTHTFERYNPDDVITTVWKVVANKTAISEGGAVRFTVTANNLPDGQILNWSAKEGALNGSSNDITSPQKTDSGTVILRNGQAVIDFATTPDDNEAEPQKHVRLTVGAPANLSINVPITDAGYNETALHITQSTNNGIDLAEYYKQQSGGYPRSDEVVRFVVDAGVDIVAPNTSTPAMINGAQWPAGNIPTIENRGRILGRGGEGGRSSEWYGGFSVNNNNGQLNDDSRWKFAENGENGGVAVKGNMIVENYGLVAGGGGGGGGGGAIAYNTPSEFSDDGVFEAVGGSGSGGGAPLGRRSPNGNTIESLYRYETQDGSVPYDYTVLEQPYLTALVQASDSNTIDYFAWYSSEYQQIKRPITLKVPSFKLKSPTYFLPHYESDGISYRIISYEVDEQVADKTKPSITNSNGVQAWQAHSVLMKQSTDAGLTTGGKYGYGGIASSGTNIDCELTLPNYFQSIDFTTHHGGNGGDVGMNGTDGINLTNPTLNKLIGRFSGNYTKAREILPAKGGLAGYIKEGSVTITNFGSGTTKGR